MIRIRVQYRSGKQRRAILGKGVIVAEKAKATHNEDPSRAAFLAKRIACRSLSVFRENYGYSFTTVWRIVLFLQLLSPIPAQLGSFDMMGAWRILAISTALGGACVAFIGRKISPLYDARIYLHIAGLLGSGSLLAIVLSLNGHTPSSFLFVEIAVGGFSYALVTLAWLQRFIARGLNSVAWNYLVGAIAGVLLFFVSEAILHDFALYFIAALPLASCLSFKRDECVEDGRGADEIELLFDDEEALKPAPPSFAMVRLFFVLVLACLSYGILCFQSFGGDSMIPPGALIGVISLDILVCVLAKIVTSFAYALRSLVVFYLIILLFCASTLCMLIVPSPPMGVACYYIASGGFQLISFMTVFKITETYHARSNAVTPFIGGVMIAQYACQLIGVSLGSRLPYEAASSIVVLVCMVAAALIIMSGTTSFQLSSPSASERKTTAIRKIASDCGLTPRETDILELWGDGHTSNYIEQQLYIAKSTVRTHLSHIYQKTGTQSKEELLQLIDRYITQQ